MGLAEKRAVKEFQENKFEGLKTEIQTAAGFPVELDVNWDTLMEDKMSHLYESAFTKVYFEPLIGALKSICADDMGKDALKAALTKVVIQNTAGVFNAARCSKFEGGILTIDHLPTSNIDDVKDRTKGIQKTLENAL